MSREVVFPASKSIMLRDVWAYEYNSDLDRILVTVRCQGCSESPEVTLVTFKSPLATSMILSECDCNTTYVTSTEYLSALPGVTLDESLLFLNNPTFILYPTSAGILPKSVVRTLKEWLSYQVGVPADEIDIDFNFN